MTGLGDGRELALHLPVACWKHLGPLALLLPVAGPWHVGMGRGGREQGIPQGWTRSQTGNSLTEKSWDSWQTRGRHLPSPHSQAGRQAVTDPLSPPGIRDISLHMATCRPIVVNYH